MRASALSLIALSACASAPIAVAPAKRATCSAAPAPPPQPRAATATAHAAAHAIPAPDPPAPQAPTPAPPPPPEPKKYKLVLSVGDSFNGAFSLALAKRFEAEGSRFVRDVWVGVAISTFDQKPRFTDLLRDTDPDLVLVSLGANDVNSNDPEGAAAHIQSIVTKIGARDCYWIAPALWKKDTGIVDVLERNTAPCRFFASKGFKVERREDGWHPSIEGGEVWATKFWEAFDAQRMSTTIVPPQGTSMLWSDPWLPTRI
jgi:lysophospholipase L1-like esterase